LHQGEKILSVVAAMLAHHVINIEPEVSPFLRKFSDHPNYQSLKKLLVGTKNEIQFLCQYLLLFQ
jgi:hypothetical protein